MKLRHIIITLALAAVGMVVSAQSAPKRALAAGECFTGKTADGDTFTVSVLDPEAMTAQIGNGDNPCMPAKKGKTITMPAKAGDYSIIRVGNGAFYSFACDSLSLPEGITSIGEESFMYATLKLHLPSTLTKVDDYAIRNSYIPEVAFPEGVTSLGRWALYASDVRKITVPSTVETWGDEALARNGSLTELILTEGLKTIGNRTFQNSTSLREVSIPSSVTAIGDYAFSATGLTTVTVPAGVTSWGQRVFANNAALKEVKFAPGITKIGSYAFFNCSALESVTVPATLVMAGNNSDQYMFGSCTGLKNVTIEEGFTVIGQRMFDGCTALESLHIPASVTSMGNSTCFNCKNLKHVTFGEGTKLKNFNTSAFGNCGFEEFTYPEGMTNTGAYAFAGCTDLKTVTLPSTLTNTDAWTFMNCTNIGTVKATKTVPPSCNGSAFGHITSTAMLIVPVGTLASYKAASGWNSFAKIEEEFDLADGSAFAALTMNGDTIAARVVSNTEKTCIIGDGTTPAPRHLISGQLNIPSKLNVYTVVGIAANAFKGQTGITAINLPDGIASIGNSAFEGCTAMEKVVLPQNVATLGDDVFAGCDNVRDVTTLITKALPVNDGFFSQAAYRDAILFCPKGTLTDYKAAGGWKQFATIGESYAAGEQFLAPVAEGPMANFEVVDALAHTVKVVNRGFTSSPSVETSVGGTITIPERVNGYSVVAINDNAFYNQKSITRMVIGNHIRSIGSSAFRACTSLASITLPDSITTLPNYLFYGCTALSAVRIPEGVTSIASYVFRGTPIKRITIPAGVTSIGTNAFQSCQSLTDVTSLGQPATLAKTSFADVAAKTLHVEEGMTETYQTADIWKDFGSIDENASGTPITDEMFPDEILRSKAKELFGDKISDDVNRTITSLQLNGLGIKDLTGIEHFEYLQELNIADNRLDSVDLTRNLTLQRFYCSGNEMKQLLVSGLAELQLLDCSDNQLEALDLAGLASLTELHADSNRLTALAPTASPALQHLTVAANRLTALTFGGNAQLTHLLAADNELTVVNLGGCPALTTVDMSRNSISTISTNALTALDTLLLADNRIGTVNLVNNTKLQRADLSGNSLKALNIGTLSQLTDLNAARNELRAVDFSRADRLEKLNLDGNVLTYVDLSTCTQITDADNVTLGTQHPFGRALYFTGTRTAAIPLHIYAKAEQITDVTYDGKAFGETLVQDVEGTPYLLFATDIAQDDINGKTVGYRYNAAIPQLPIVQMAVDYAITSLATGISSINNEPLTMNNDGVWYTLDGQKLNARPTQRGIYIHNGEKVVIK